MNLSQADFIIFCFGGIRPTARRLGEMPNTVQQWKKQGFITSSKHQKIIDAAKEDGLPITPESLLYPPNKTQLAKLKLTLSQEKLT